MFDISNNFCCWSPTAQRLKSMLSGRHNSASGRAAVIEIANAPSCKNQWKSAKEKQTYSVRKIC